MQTAYTDASSRPNPDFINLNSGEFIQVQTSATAMLTYFSIQVQLGVSYYFPDFTSGRAELPQVAL
jgi:hypothetical protein